MHMRFPHHQLQGKLLVSEPVGMHHGTCATHVLWWMPGSLTRGGGNVPGIPGACGTRNFTYLTRGPWASEVWTCSGSRTNLHPLGTDKGLVPQLKNQVSSPILIWSLARQFSPSPRCTTSSGPTWTWKCTFLQPAAIHSCQDPSHWDILTSVGDWDSHIGALVGVFSDALGGPGFSIHNKKGEIILEFATVNGLRIGNTCCKKRVLHLITYSSGGDSIQQDYILNCKRFSSAISNVKVILNEECVKQQHMVVCDFTAHIPRVKKRSTSGTESSGPQLLLVSFGQLSR